MSEGLAGKPLDPMRQPILVDEFGRNLAIFSPDRVYRYVLTREWDHALQKLPVVGLNPSTATAEEDDPTIRRCIGFAKGWGYGGLVMLNLFAFRATDPKAMIAHLDAGGDIVGPVNDAALAQYMTAGREILCAWGAHGMIEGRSPIVAKRFEWYGARCVCLGRTKGGEPRHPLYIAAATEREPFAR